MSSGVSLFRPPGPLAGVSGLQNRHSFRPAIRSRPIRCQSTTDANSDLKVRVKDAVEGAGFRSNVTWEDFLGDRSDKVKDGNTVTWPNEKVYELWKVFFKAGDGYSDVFGVAWPLRTDKPKPSAEDIELARARAAKDLVNIDSDERRRRVIFGSIVTAIIVTLMVVAAKLHAHPLERAGVWDVDGTGMQAVDDPEVDLGIRKKLIGFVSAGAIGTLIVMVPYILWPF